MASRRDELRAHQFLKQRAVAALVVHQTDPEQPPFRRPLVSAFWGLGLALVGLTVAGALSLFSHSSKLTLQDGKNVIVDQDSEAMYVPLNGQLDRVPNLVSAYLVLGQHVPTERVPSQQIVGIKRGPQLGIPNAPTALPTSSELLKHSWAMCSQPRTNSAGGGIEKSALLVGQTPKQGIAAGDNAILVKAGAHGSVYMIWQGYRHRLATATVDLAALNQSTTRVIPVSTAWLNTVPIGADIRPITVPNIGAASTVLAGEEANVASGQIFRVAGATEAQAQYYLVSGNTLQEITEFQAILQRADPATQEFPYGGQQPRFRKLTPIEAQDANPKAMPDPADSDPPPTMPDFVPFTTTRTSVCASFAPAAAVPTLSVDAKIPGGGTSVGGSSHGTPLADRVVVTGGEGAFIRVIGHQDQTIAGTLALVTDDGTLYPLATADVVKMLGYDGIKPINITAALATRLPRGPVLDPTVAKQPH